MTWGKFATETIDMRILLDVKSEDLRLPDELEKMSMIALSL